MKGRIGQLCIIAIIGIALVSEFLVTSRAIFASPNEVIKSSKSIEMVIDENDHSTTEKFSVRKDGRSKDSKGTELFRIQEDGNVGIGTAQPLGKLHVVDSDIPGNGIDDDGDGGTDETWQFMVFSKQGNLGIGTTNPTSILEITSIGPVIIKANADSDGFDGGPRTISFGVEEETADGDQNLGFMVRDETAGGAYRFFINKSGNVGIGTTSPQHPLQMGSGAHVTAAGVWTDASSREYKENIRDLTVDEAMATLDGLRPSRFNYKVDKEDEYVGFVAEDVPELVATKDRKGLSPMDLTAVLTKVVQEQQQTISALTQEMEALKTTLNKLLADKEGF